MDAQRLFLVGAAVVQLTLWLAFAGRYRNPTAPPGSVVLRYGDKLRMLGLCVAFAIPLLMILLFIVTPLRLTPRPLPLGFTLLALGFIGGMPLLETQGVFLIVGPETIVSLSPWRRRREWRWDEVVQVRYSILNRWLILSGPRQEIIRTSLFLVGIGELARALIRHVSGMKWTPARKVLERLAARSP